MLWNLQDESLSKKVVARVLEAKREGGERRQLVIRFLGQCPTRVTSSDTEIPLGRAVIQ